MRRTVLATTVREDEGAVWQASNPNPFANLPPIAFVPPMGKIARVVLVLAQVVVSILGIFFGASVLPDLVTAEGGDEVARGHRAMAILGSMFAGMTILLGAFAIDMYTHPFLDVTSIMAVLLAAIAAPILIYIPLDRRISRLERERAEAAPKLTTES